MVNGNEWEERKMGRATEQEQDQQRAVRGGGKTFVLWLLILLLLSSSFFLFLFMDTNFGIPTRQGSSQSFSGGEGGFSLFKKKGSVGHSLPSVTLVSSLVVVLF